MFRTLRFYHSFFKFLSTPSSRRATGAARHHATVPTYFYPRPPRGGRRLVVYRVYVSFQFLSTPSARRATRLLLWYIRARYNFYPRPPRGGRQCTQGSSTFTTQISIHALREEGDGLPLRLRGQTPGISIHALLAEGDIAGLPPRRRYRSDFYPRPPRGGRRFRLPSSNCTGCISIHALLAEGDLKARTHRSNYYDFYPRPPRGGRLLARSLLSDVL